jgi:hypothetical protein
MLWYHHSSACQITSLLDLGIFFADYEEITAVICAHNFLEILLRD